MFFFCINVNREFKYSIISSNLTRIRVKPWKYNPYILLEFLQSDIGKGMLKSLQTGTTITLVNNKQLSRLEVPMYSQHIMDEIGQQLKTNHKTYQKQIKSVKIQPEENDIVTWVDVDFAEYRKKVDNRAVKKNCTIPYWLNVKAEKAGINFSKVLQEALLEVLGTSE